MGRETENWPSVGHADVVFAGEIEKALDICLFQIPTATDLRSELQTKGYFEGSHTRSQISGRVYQLREISIKRLPEESVLRVLINSVSKNLKVVSHP